MGLLHVVVGAWTTSGRIEQTISEDPGITKSELRDSFDLAWGTVDYHVGKLTGKERIKQWQRPPAVHLFSNEVPSDLMPCLGELRRGVNHSVLRAMDESEANRILAMSNDLGHSRKVIRRALMHLEDVELVEKRGSHQPEFYPSPKWARAKEWLASFKPRRLEA